MADTTKTFGEFFDAVAKTKIIEGEMWLEEWKDMITEDEWTDVRQLPLCDEGVIGFAQDMVTLFRERMAGICTDALYTSTSQRGHAFLAEVKAVALRFGVDVAADIDVPITPSEAVKKAQKLHSHTGKILQLLRSDLDLTPTDLSRVLHEMGIEINLQEIAAIEEGGQIPTSPQYLAWCEALAQSPVFVQSEAKRLADIRGEKPPP